MQRHTEKKSTQEGKKIPIFLLSAISPI